VLLPIPDEAPVMTIVLPSRRLDIAEDAIVRMMDLKGLRSGCEVLIAEIVRRNLLLLRRGSIGDGFEEKCGGLMFGED
jgi:hypothetical protein